MSFFSGVSAWYHRALSRFVRAAIATGAGLAISRYQNNVWYVAATPLLMSAAKALRERYPDNELVKLIPF